MCIRDSYAADFTAVGAAITLRVGSTLSKFRRWCRRYAADFTAVGAAITLRLGAYAAQIFAVGVGVMLPILLLLVLLLHYG